MYLYFEPKYIHVKKSEEFRDFVHSAAATTVQGYGFYVQEKKFTHVRSL